jgi:hypothetical protein
MSTIPSEEKLTNEIAALRETIVKLEQRWSGSMQTKWQLALSFLKGVVSALGAIAAVGIITPLFLWFLRGFEWPPLIADVISKVILQVEQVNHQSPRGVVDQ